MAISKCKECRKSVSSKADLCPNCGAPIKNKRRVGCLGRAALAFLVFIAIGQVLVYFQESAKKKSDQKTLKTSIQKTREKAIAKKRQRDESNKRISSFFINNKDLIMNDLRRLYEFGDYIEAEKKAKEYLVSNDKDLKAFYNELKPWADAVRNERREEAILEKLKTIPANHYERIYRLYNDLTTLYPNNKKYKNEKDHYSAIIKKEKEKMRLAAERRKRIQSLFGGDDGYRVKIDRLIKSTMHDPDSYEYVKTTYTEDGDYLIIETTFRGKNRLGAKGIDSIKHIGDLNGNILGRIE